MSLFLEIYLPFLIMGVCSLAQICSGSRYQPSARPFSFSGLFFTSLCIKFSLYPFPRCQWTWCASPQGDLPVIIDSPWCFPRQNSGSFSKRMYCFLIVQLAWDCIQVTQTWSLPSLGLQSIRSKRKNPVFSLVASIVILPWLKQSMFPYELFGTERWWAEARFLKVKGWGWHFWSEEWLVGCGFAELGELGHSASFITQRYFESLILITGFIFCRLQDLSYLVLFPLSPFVF